ncbi:MAG: response regulator transcription factor [Myxococcaceae bacterium]|nr:response regulator transcription factor [Myxococcaceae bacterium]
MTERLRVLIADDEQVARSRLQRLLKAMPDVEVVGECEDGDQVLTRVREGGVDVVLLDIQMPKLKGTEALALWPKDGPQVVFCTAHGQHALEAFDGGALDYVLKPVEAARLSKALARARERGSAERFQEVVSKFQIDRLPITTRQGVVLIDPDSISHAVLEGELVTVFAGNEKHLTDYSLNELEERLGRGRFERVHRRALLNLKAVARLEPLDTGGYFARTHSGHSVEVSRQAARDLRKRLGLRKGNDDE